LRVAAVIPKAAAHLAVSKWPLLSERRCLSKLIPNAWP
jgi:hypothetical protein